MAASAPVIASLYQPLSSEDYEIRLLTLLPGDFDSSMISCTLAHMSLNEIIKYEALSYAWGNPSVTETILVNGNEWQATRNLVAALRQLRSQEPRTLWVDAICINQANEPAAREERALQLRRMKEIFSAATSVIAWVGTEDASSSRVFDLMEEMRKNRSLLESFKKDTISRENREARDVFFARPYWRRVWIVQELAMAKILWVQCGPRKTLWKNLQPILVNVKLVDFNRFRNSVQQDQPVTLLEALFETRTSLATVPVDKVYALLGLASDGPTIIPRPTYKWPVETVLTGMTRIILEKKRCLDLITLKLPVSNHAGMPSWVPDWTELERAIGPGQEKHISSSRNEQIYLQFYENALEVRGRRLHTIDGVTSSIYDGRQITPMTQPSQRSNEQIMSKGQFWALLAMRSFSPSSYKLLGQINGICSSDGEQLINQQFPALAAWLQTNRGLEMGGKQLGSYFEPASPENGFGVSVVKGIGFVAKFYATPIWAGKTLFGKRRRPLKEWYDDIDTTLWKQPKFSDLGLERFLQRVQGTLEQGFKLVITTRGVVGLAPARTQSNDQVYLIDGCSVPVILRNREGGLEVIGEACFLPPLKDTEATTTLEEREANHKLILI